MCARFTVLSDTPIAAAIAGCAIPLSRNNTIWMRWRCAAGIFHRSAVLTRRTSALLHLTICFPESDGAANHTSGNKNNQQFPPLTSKIPRFKPLWRWYYFAPYKHVADPHIDDADEGMSTASIRKLFGELERGLAPLVDAICGQPSPDDS